MKVLIIAFSESIHTARWISQIDDQGWQIFLFSSKDYYLMNRSIKNVEFCRPFSFIRNPTIYSLIYKAYRFYLKVFRPHYLERRLSNYIKKIKPDVIHSLETQAAGYLVSSVKNIYHKKENFPVWWHTIWGSDLYMFGRLEEHNARVKAVLKKCDFFSCECQRDYKLARKLGFQGVVLQVSPFTGGFDLENLSKLRSNIQKPSERKTIMLKGYQGWSGRALVGLRALYRARDILHGYSIVIYSNTDAEDVIIASELFAYEAGIEVKLIPKHSPHEEILKLQGNARISIGLSISDGISNAMLEAMAMGSMPIQSTTSQEAEDEWIKDGENGLLVPPEDPDIVESAIRKALLDDHLVDRAASINWEIVKERLDFNSLKQVTINSYKEAYDHSKTN